MRRRLLALVVGGITLALSPAAALAIGYNLDHDHDVENVVAVRAHEPGTLVTGWQWQIRDGKKRANVGLPADQLARLLAINPNGGRFSDLLVRGHAGNSGFPESLWQWNGSHARQLWSSSSLPSNVRPPPGQYLFDAGWSGEWAPKFTRSGVSGGVLDVVPAVTKNYYVGACRACATASIVTVRWTWVPRVDRYVYSGESGLP